MWLTWTLAVFGDIYSRFALPGAVVLIQQHGKPVYLKCFGVRDVATRLPMTPDTIFAIHSMTKHSSIMAQREATSRTMAEVKLEPTVDVRGSAGARMGVSIGF